MSLKVWLPLNGTLENLGLSTVPDGFGASATYGTGKIGALAYNTNVSSTTKLWPELVGLTTFSIAYWFKCEPVTSTAWSDLWGLQYSTSNNTIAYMREERQANTYTDRTRFYFIKDTTKVDTYSYYGTALFTGANSWSHMTITKTPEEWKIYRNGTLLNTYTCSTYENSPGSLTGNFYLGMAGSNGFLNDFRIYDHCLSAAEVREISQGLILHYKLDEINDNYSKNNNTAWTNINIGQYYTIIFSYTMADFLAATGAKNGDKFTWSLDIKTTSGTKHIAARVQHYNSGSDRNSVVGNQIGPNSEGRSSVVFTINTNYNQLDFMINNIDSSTVTANSTEQYRCTRIQAGNVHTNWLPTNISKTIEDSSGYGHNGTIVGNLNLINNTPRYSSATNFNGSSAIKYTSFNLGNIWSAGMWFYSSSSVTTGWGALFTVNTSGGDTDLKMNLYLQQTSGKIQYSANGQYDSSPTFTKDVWHHLMETFDGTTLSCYLDGALIKTKAITNAEFTRSNLYVGARSNAANGSSASNYINAYISDFRIYCTALNAAAVKQLYELGAKVDNKGNIHGYEFVEKNAPKIYKTGIIEHKEVRESQDISVGATTMTYTPAANTNNSCSGNINVDFSPYQDLGKDIIIMFECDIAWNNLAAGTGGTFGIVLQGTNRARADNSWKWEGTNYVTGGYNFTSQVTANKTGTLHRKVTNKIPASWFNTYNGSRIQFRTNYSNGSGTVTMSNVKVSLSPIFKIDKEHIQSNQLIEI